MAIRKVIPFLAPPVSPPQKLAEERSGVTIQVGSQRYAIEISCKATARLTPASGWVVQTRYLHLREPIALSQWIDGWRVCWVGGWDKGKVFFVVMVERTVRGEVSNNCGLRFP